MWVGLDSICVYLVEFVVNICLSWFNNKYNLKVFYKIILKIKGFLDIYIYSWFLICRILKYLELLYSKSIIIYKSLFLEIMYYKLLKW